MDLRFAPPNLRRLDQLGTEVLVASLASDERPPRGLAGLVDYRLSGRISRLVRDGFSPAQPGDVLLVPGKPKLPFDKLLLFGIGPAAAFDEAAFRTVIGAILETLTGLRARTAVVELPGRHFDAIAPERAADLLLESAGTQRAHDVWTLVETSESQRAITQHLALERRKQREE